MNWRERVYCDDLSPTPAGRKVLLMGWVDAIRDHGNIFFIHLRDNRGIVQVVFDPAVSKESYEEALALSEEYVVLIKGVIQERAWGTENPNLETGNVEVLAQDLTILSPSKTLPFPISEKAMVFGEELKSVPNNVEEELRLRYRYLDLRRPSVQALFKKRYEIVKVIRTYLDELRFIEIETPVLTKSTPEGARDYLVPSRVHKGRFYALPQSPQLFKQLLMMGGMDRYFQIVKCFRDEDLRPNRQPEFTQLDMEASFIDEGFIYEIVEELTARMFLVGGIDLHRPFPRMTYAEAMDRYGTDRPDLRFGMSFEKVTDILGGTEYGVFRRVIQEGGEVRGFCIRGQAATLSKNILQNEYAMKIVPSLGGSGMTWMKVSGGKLESNIAQFFTEFELSALMERFGARDGDVLMLIADRSDDLVLKVLCELRLHVAARLGLIDADGFCPLWVTDFPLFEQKDGEIGSQHHPFTMPDRVDFDPADKGSLLGLSSRAYDLVVNGEELGGGSIRIHRMDVQKKIFQALGLHPEEIEEKFGFFIRALEYGAPPHAGLALGLDRVIAMILKAPSIREVIAFPKNRSAVCPLTRAPSPVDRSQIDELGLAAGVLSPGHDKSPGEKPGREPLPASTGITEGEVMHVAKLARLKLTLDEAEIYRRELNAVLEHFETLQELDTTGVAPMSHVLRLKNVWREDGPARSEDPLLLLKNAPDKESGYFKVPKILEG